jgi:hypothetical protein
MPDRTIGKIIGGRTKLQARYLSLTLKTKLVRDMVRTSPELFGLDMFEPVIKFLKESVLEESQFENPSVSDLNLCFDEITNEWNLEVARSFILLLASDLKLKAQSNAEKFMLTRISIDLSTNNWSTSEADTGNSDLQIESFDNEESLISDEDLLYTPLTKALILLILSVAAEEDGAIDQGKVNRDDGTYTFADIEAIISELITSNFSKLNYWFLSGFASGLGLIPRD